MMDDLVAESIAGPISLCDRRVIAVRLAELHGLIDVE